MDDKTQKNNENCRNVSLGAHCVVQKVGPFEAKHRCCPSVLRCCCCCFVANTHSLGVWKLLPDGRWEAKFIMDGISKKLIKDGIHSTIRVIFLALVSF